MSNSKKIAYPLCMCQNESRDRLAQSKSGLTCAVRPPQGAYSRLSCEGPPGRVQVLVYPGVALVEQYQLTPCPVDTGEHGLLESLKNDGK